jgi:hypothetical protein
MSRDLKYKKKNNEILLIVTSNKRQIEKKERLTYTLYNTHLGENFTKITLTGGCGIRFPLLL